VLVVSVDRQNGVVPAGATMARTMPVESVVDATVAAPCGVTCNGVQPPSPSTVMVRRSRAPALMQTTDVSVSAGRCVMATVPDMQPFGTGVVGIAVSVLVWVMRSGEAVELGLGC
jgi:hypothetical protein